jgi:hypothetical protein
MLQQFLYRVWRRLVERVDGPLLLIAEFDHGGWPGDRLQRHL